MAISQLLMELDCEDESAYFQEDSHASHSVKPVFKRDLMMIVEICSFIYVKS